MSQGRIIPAKSLAGGLAWSRRAWFLAACVGGAMLTFSVGFYLYIAFVNYVIEKTGSTFHTGAESLLFQAMLDLTGPFDLTLAVVQAFTLLFFLRWTWLSVHLANAVRRDSVRYSARLAIVGFFVPVANLWMPLYTLIDLEDFSAESESRTAPSIPWYPAGIVLSATLATGLMQIVSAAPADGFSDPAASQHLMQVAAVGAIAHLVLLMLVHAYMQRLSSGQELALVELTESEGMSSPDSGEGAAAPGRSADDFSATNP